MKYFWILFLTTLSISACSQSATEKKKTSKKVSIETKTQKNEEIHDGDIIFQETTSDFSKAIQLATKSRYSHVGIIFKKDNEWKVLEAVQPVRVVSLDQFIKKGKDEHYVIKRWKADSLINETTKVKMFEVGKEMIGKNYDSKFGWSDDEIYCSELVWKIYYKTFGLGVSELETLHSFDLDHPLVKKQLEASYGKDIPLGEPLISPIGLFNSDQFKTVVTVN